MSTRPLICIFHGPLVFDEGDAAWIARLLAPDSLVVAGVMGRTAARESGLPVSFADLPPSGVINGIDGDCILVNRGKTPASGRRFGEIVASRIRQDRGLIHLECSDCTCYAWNGGNTQRADEIAATLGYRMVALQSEDGDDPDLRQISGCLPGEPVMVEGITIGHATSDHVILSREGGRLVPVSGLCPKESGLLRLHARGCPPLDRAWCKTGPIRSIRPEESHRTAPPCGRISIIDHGALTIYRQITPDTCGILTIGDDTTLACGHIGAVAGVPVFGITDGDADGIVPEAYAPGSVIVHVLSGTDDELGPEIAASIPNHRDLCWDMVVARLLEEFSDRICILRDLR